MSKQHNQTEFFSPFVHIPGKYEWCRIHSPSHGSFDTFIVIESTTDQPVTVYVNCKKGEAFMADRYPESRCIRVPRDALSLCASETDGLVSGCLKSKDGPVKEAFMMFLYDLDERPKATPYGGEAFRVWGSRWTCVGVDLERKAEVKGYVLSEKGETLLRNISGIVTAGSFGRIEEISSLS